MRKIQCCGYRKWLVMGALLLLVSGFGAGCAHFQSPVENSKVLDGKEGLKKEFKRYWSLAARKEVDEMFAREAPYIQEVISKKRYRLYMKFMTKAELRRVDILNMTCEQPFLCCVDCRMTTMVEGREVVKELRDCWVRVKSDWFHVFKNPIFFPMLGKAPVVGKAASG